MAFVQQYLLDLNVPRAAKAAGYSATMAASKCYMWVKDPDAFPAVYKAIQQGMADRAARVEVTQDRVVKELARIAFLDPRKIVAWTEKGVTLVPSDELPDDDAAAIAEIAETQSGIKVKFVGKIEALRLLAQHIGMDVDRGSNVTVVNTSLADIIAGLTDDERKAIRPILERLAREPSDQS